jgi:3-oxoacyl-[acyl-carrier-protein] synthase-3
VSERLRAKITALGTYVPPRVLTNKDFEKMVETTDEWILTRTGIRERHVVDKGVATSDLATEAAKCALDQRGIDPKDLDAIIVATVTPDMFFPSTACPRRLGIRSVGCVLRFRLCLAGRHAIHHVGHAQESNDNWGGHDVVDPRLH